jgi:hypothetical protein
MLEGFSLTIVKLKKTRMSDEPAKLSNPFSTGGGGYYHPLLFKIKLASALQRDFRRGLRSGGVQSGCACSILCSRQATADDECGGTNGHQPQNRGFRGRLEGERFRAKPGGKGAFHSAPCDFSNATSEIRYK